MRGSAGVGKAVLLPEFRFASPSGPHAIGTVTQHWVDPTRSEILGSAPGQQHRELVAQILYPARPSAAQPTPYLTEPDAAVPGLARVFGMPEVALRHLAGVTTNVVAGATPGAGGQLFPVVVMLTGLGGFRQATTYLAELVLADTSWWASTSHIRRQRSRFPVGGWQA